MSPGGRPWRGPADPATRGRAGTGQALLDRGPLVPAGGGTAPAGRVHRRAARADGHRGRGQQTGQGDTGVGQARSAAAVPVAGIVSFVGLVVPHTIRMATGPGHRVLLPASALGGGLLLLAADLLARTVAAPAEIPLGVVTAALGGPFFFHLLYRTHARQGGWS